MAEFDIAEVPEKDPRTWGSMEIAQHGMRGESRTLIHRAPAECESTVLTSPRVLELHTALICNVATKDIAAVRGRVVGSGQYAADAYRQEDELSNWAKASRHAAVECKAAVDAEWQLQFNEVQRLAHGSADTEPRDLRKAHERYNELTEECTLLGSVIAYLTIFLEKRGYQREPKRNDPSPQAGQHALARCAIARALKGHGGHSQPEGISDGAHVETKAGHEPVGQQAGLAQGTA